MEQVGASWIPGIGYALGYEEDGKLICGVLYTDWNGRAIQGHVAAIPGKQWVRREFLFTAFWYPFIQLRCSKIIGPVPAANHEARRFDEHLGFVLEATLKDAHPTGDLLLLSMTRDQCRWLPSTREPHGKTLSTAST
jgi:RimJ/RimL family protein N-acetyltransferase